MFPSDVDQAHDPDSVTERRAAIAKRRQEREHRDLFATRPPEFGSIRETLRPPPPGVAARNETSVLFRVGDVEPAKAKPTRERADSGLILLGAAAAAAPAPRAIANPLASEPPPAAFAREVEPGAKSPATFPPPSANAPSPRARGLRDLAVAAAVFLACGLGVSAVFAGENPAPKPAAALPALPPPPVLAADFPTSMPPAAPREASVASASTSQSAGHAPAAVTSVHRARKPKASVKHATSSQPATRTVKPADPCHCRGDFNCQIACAAGKRR